MKLTDTYIGLGGKTVYVYEGPAWSSSEARSLIPGDFTVIWEEFYQYESETPEYHVEVVYNR